MRTISILILLFFTYSLLGWLLEVTCKWIEQKKFINRGFLIGPYCPIYGYGVLIMTLLLSKYLNDPFTLWIMIILSCSLLEYFTSYILEKIFATRWWDYSKRKCNINGRICLETMIPFSFFGMLIMYKINPFFYTIYEKIPTMTLIILASLMSIIYITDNIISFKIIKDIQKVSKDTQKKQLLKKDDTERITMLVKKKIENSKKTLEKRIIHAFPNLELQRIKWQEKRKKHRK